MIIKKLNFKNVLLIKPKIFRDERGFFFENLKINSLEKVLKYKVNFIQENISISKKNTFRGMHFQIKPYEQAKLVTVLRGSIYDIIVDLNKKSKTYKKKKIIKLDSKKFNSVFVPRGYAHGFISLENDTLVKYNIDNIYNPKSERCLSYREINFDKKFSKKNLIISKKDIEGKSFRQLGYN